MDSVTAAGIAGVIARADFTQKFVTFLLLVMSARAITPAIPAAVTLSIIDPRG